MSNGKPLALVTGGARRVGRAIVEKLAQAGFDVTFTYLTSEREAQELAGRIAGQAIRADLTDPASAVEQIAQAMSIRARRLDVLVNNASLYQPSPIDSTGLPQMRRLMAIHYESPLLLVQRLAPQLRASRGHIINMLDLLAERPWPQYAAYCASKAALWNLTLSMARELAPEVTVNGIAPGVVEWPDDFPEPQRQEYLRRVPLGRAGTAQDVANLVHFLITQGQYITGQVIRLDGGRWLT
ncbi:SDR family oxidoreductase [Fontivita pretiosa]|jgi:pteridine reductase|uniref:SDR family oxidoreductase n=1 Tax=Fontivita pretiosa TaxID=2989684 RepID=UPI003D17D11C